MASRVDLYFENARQESQPPVPVEIKTPLKTYVFQYTKKSIARTSRASRASNLDKSLVVMKNNLVFVKVTTLNML